MRKLAFLFALFAVIIMAPNANAHSKSVSYSDWSIASDDTVIARVRIPARLTTLLLVEQPNQDAFAVAMEHVKTNITLGYGSEACEQNDPAVQLAGAPDMLVFEISFECPTLAGGNLMLKNDAFFALAANHLHFIRSVSGEPVSVHETVLTASDREAHLFPTDGSSSPNPNDWALFQIGVKHILGGPDHLVFVLGLLLVAGPGRSLLIAVTGFTIGHSLSLAAAVTGFATADGASVEALIALTIWLLGAVALHHHFSSNKFALLITSAGLLVTALVASLVFSGKFDPLFWIGTSILALSYLSLSTREHRAVGPMAFLLTTSLGLAHGFGFAGGLQEAFGETNSLAISLLAFNLGVEAGQLLFVATILAIALALRHLPTGRLIEVPAQRTVAVLVAAAGAFWFAERTILTSVL